MHHADLFPFSCLFLSVLVLLGWGERICVVEIDDTGVGVGIGIGAVEG